MKKGFMNKKVNEYTGWETVKYLGVVLAMTYAVSGVVLAAVTYWDKIGNWFKNKFYFEFSVHKHTDDEETFSQEENGLY